MVLGLRPHPRRLKTQQRAVGDRWRWNPLEHTRFACIQTGLVCTGSSVRPTLLWHIMSIRRQSTGLDRSLSCLALPCPAAEWMAGRLGRHRYAQAADCHATAHARRRLVGAQATSHDTTRVRVADGQALAAARAHALAPRLTSPRLPLARLGSVATQCAPRMPLVPAAWCVACSML